MPALYTTAINTLVRRRHVPCSLWVKSVGDSCNNDGSPFLGNRHITESYKGAKNMEHSATLKSKSK